MIVEILRNSLYQSDADPRVLSLLAERGITLSMVIDLRGIESPSDRLQRNSRELSRFVVGLGRGGR